MLCVVPILAAEPGVEGMMAFMDVLRSVIEELAPIPRLPTSNGERAAAYLIRDRLEGHGCRAAVEEVRAYSSYAYPIGCAERRRGDLRGGEPAWAPGLGRDRWRRCGGGHRR